MIYNSCFDKTIFDTDLKGWSLFSLVSFYYVLQIKDKTSYTLIYYLIYIELQGSSKTYDEKHLQTDIFHISY